MSGRTCRSCGQAIKWAVTVKGRRIPLDPEPHEDGNLAVWEQAGGVLRARYLPDGESPLPREVLMVSHFATCPDASKHRHPRKALATI